MSGLSSNIRNIQNDVRLSFTAHVMPFLQSYVVVYHYLSYEARKESVLLQARSCKY